MSSDEYRVFISGGTGVIGRRVVPLLLTAGHQVTAIARTETKAAALEALGARPVQIDIFSKPQVLDEVADHDVVLHLATNIPTGSRAALKSAWRTNDRLRSEAAANLAAAAIQTDSKRYVGESITFPYVDLGDEWIPESAERSHFWGNQTVVGAEAAAHSLTEAGGVGVSLRFAGFFAPDSAHTQMFRSVASRGISPLPGNPAGYISFIDIADAAKAVVASLDVDAGIYNVAEAAPMRRSDHADALATLDGNKRLRTIPKTVQRLGGKGVDSLSRSHRIDSKKLCDASAWQPQVAVIDRWKDLR